MPVAPLCLTQIDTRHDNVTEALDALRARLSPRGNVVSEASRQRTIDVFGEPLTPQQVVERVCRDIEQDGLAPLLHYTQQFDRARLTAADLRVPREELAEAHRETPPDFLDAVRTIRQNVWEFQRSILHHDHSLERPPGVRLTQRYLPLSRIGVCVPGGAAAYPSTVLMTAVPAQAAGVAEIAIMAPPTPFGAYNRTLLATCHELGITEVYRMGGAQGVAALAYGIKEHILPVDKMVGPGNLFVALAKRHVYGQVAIDSIAGPSEVAVVADEGANPAHLAADMLAQAEHAPGASVLLTWCDAIMTGVVTELNRQLQQLERAEVTRHSLQDFGALIRVRDIDEACEMVNAIAPEHLHLATANAAELVPRMRNAGATFVGYYTPVAVGDYIAGPSHVLPTSGTARWASGLTANDFLRSSSVIEYDQASLQSIAADLARIANEEGLTAHRRSVEIRLPHDT